MLYSHNNGIPDQLPFRIKINKELEDGTTVSFTRTDPSTFTDEELKLANFVRIDTVPPEHDSKTEKLVWNQDHWDIVPLTESEIQDTINNLWKEIRNSRDRKIEEVEWRIHRYQSEVRQGLDPTDNIDDLDSYIQALRDITNQEDPYNIVWPVLPIQSDDTVK